MSQDIALLGRMRLISVVGATDAILSLDLRPASGFRWQVLEAWGYHGNTAATICGWRYEDGTNDLGKAGVSLATGAQLDLGRSSSLNSICSLMTLSRDVYAQFKTYSANEAGRVIGIAALVMEYAG